jgi:putative aldouronate transport system permease protein
MERGKVILWPLQVQFEAFSAVFAERMFWVNYANTLFVTFYGTIFSVITTIMGAYTLSKRGLPFRTFLSFFIVFTMWFVAGFVPQYLNYLATKNFFNLFTNDNKWVVVVAMGMAAFNVVLLRNAFENVPKEIEEAAIVDGATESQLLRKVYLPMSKATIATITLFYAISRWNGYFWASVIVDNANQMPLQVFIRNRLSEILNGGEGAFKPPLGANYTAMSFVYAMVVVAIVPIIVVYPYIQKYFAKGVNMGGVKE